MRTRAQAWKEEAHLLSPCSRAACAPRPGRAAPAAAWSGQGFLLGVQGGPVTPLADGEVEVDEEVTRARVLGPARFRADQRPRKGDVWCEPQDACLRTVAESLCDLTGTQGLGACSPCPGEARMAEKS